MKSSFLASSRRFLDQFTRHRDRARGPLARPVIEVLESRIAPATFTVVGTALNISLQNQNETITFHTDGTNITASLVNGTVAGGGAGVAGVGTSTATITSADFTSITITEAIGIAGNAVHFIDSGAQAYPQAFMVNLANAGSSDITFSGHSTFSASANLTTAAGSVTSDAGSLLSFGSNLAITAMGHDVLLNGEVNVSGTTSIAAKLIVANNPSNSFTGAVQLTGPAEANVFANGPLNLAPSSFAFGSLNQTSLISAAGNITQSGTLAATGTGTLEFSSAGGDITLTNTNNSVPNNVALAFSATGTHSVSFYNATTTQLGNVTLGTGPFAITSTGNVSQQAGTAIVTDGAVAVTIDVSTNRNIILNSVGNHIAGAVTIAESGGGSVQDVSLTNAADNAATPTGTPLTTVGDVRNLTLNFPHSGIALAGYNITGALNVTAGGDVTQTAALTVGSTTTVNLLGDFQVALTNTANALTGAVDINAAQSTHAISVVDNLALIIGPSNVGRGQYSATAVTGNITETGAFVEEPGAATATFTVTAGTSISLTNNANQFTGPVSLQGAALTTANFHNSDPQAEFSQLSLPASVTTLTVVFNQAPLSLPNLTLATLTTNAQGITQQSGTGLSISGQATFNANAFPLTLSGANHFNDLTFSNSGRNDVVINDVDPGALTFTVTSAFGTGRLTVTTSGDILETGVISQASGSPSGALSFSSSAGRIALNTNNTFVGPFSASVQLGNPLNVNDQATLILGNITTISGGFAAMSGGSGILQDPNSVLDLGAASAFFATGGTIILNNHGNTFGGSAGFLADTVSVYSTGPISLAQSTVANALTVTTAGASSDSISQTGAIGPGGNLTLNAGTANIVLTNAANSFSSLSLSSTGTSVAITDGAGTLNIGSIQVGGGTLNLFDITSIAEEAGGSIVQTSGAGLVTLGTGLGGNIQLTKGINHFLGQVAVPGSVNVSIGTAGDLTFTASSAISGDLLLNVGGTLTLPSNLTSLTSFSASAHLTKVTSNITTSAGDIDFQGVVALAANLTLTTGGSIDFAGDVNPAGALTLDLPANGSVMFDQGHWNQGSNPLTINGAAAGFTIGHNAAPPAAFSLASGTLSMPGGGNFIVNSAGALNVGGGPTPNVVTIDNGSGALTINGTLGIGFGTTNDELFKTGNGVITLGATAQLRGSGLAGASASPVLVSQGGILVGHFVNSVDSSGNAHDFLAGSDIVTPAYSPTQLSVQAGGTASTNGTATGFLPDGDAYTVSSSLGASAKLAVVAEVDGHLSVVVRDTAAAGATKLSITTSGGGDGLFAIDGVSVHSPGSVSISAPKADFIGSILTVGALTALTAHDLVGVSGIDPLQISDGGAASASTHLTAHLINNANIILVGSLGSFKAVSVDANVAITAAKFGSITTTGDAAGSSGSDTTDPGDFIANLTSTASTPGTVLSSVKVAGAIGGNWDLGGNVGSVTAAKANGLSLGTTPGANVENGGLLANVSKLKLGPVTNSVFNVTGAIASLTTSDITNSGFVAATFGTIKVAANVALGLTGTVSTSTFTATGNVGGVAIKSFTTAGDFNNSTITLENGDATKVAIGRTSSQSAFTAMDAGGHGNFKTITAGAWSTNSINAHSIGSLGVVGNKTAGLLGIADSLDVTLSGNTHGLGLGNFSAQSDVTNSTFDIQSGNLTAFTVGGQLGATTVQLDDPNLSALGTIQAAEWTNGDSIIARTIGTIASVGAAATAHSGALAGDIETASIHAYLQSDATAAIAKIRVLGDLANSSIEAQHGIGALTIGRTVSGSFIYADDSMANAINVGRISTLTAGAWSQSIVSANTLGAVKITGAATPEDDLTSSLPGNVVGGTFLAHGATPTKPTGIGSFSVAGGITNSVVGSPSGIGSMTVAGDVSSSSINTENPAAPASGFITSLTVGQMDFASIRAGSIGTVKVTGNASQGLLGNVSSSTIAIDSAATVKGGLQALGSLSVSGDFADSLLDAPESVGSIKVLGRITTVTTGARIEAGYAAGAHLGTLTAGAWGEPGTLVTTNLVTQSVNSFTLVGNTHRGFAGTSDGAFIDTQGASAAGVGLGTFTASGAVTNSLLRVADGDVTSVTVERFISSDLLVGFTFPKADDITVAPTSAQWSATNHKIGSFKTTGAFSATDPIDSAAFQDSDVIAAILGNITLSGVNPADSNATTFGVAFRAAGAAAGTVKINGSPTALTAPDVNGQFNYLGLSG